MSIATQVIIFAATAIGLNIVVGLAGLLDLGYIAFLGVGAYTAALLSDSAFATVGVHVRRSCSSSSSAPASRPLFGVIIGAPTLRLRGDYLAIVTLGFGEIFRITMGNLDGNNGPEPHQRPQRHPRHPGPRRSSASTSARPHIVSASPSAGSPTTTSCCCSSPASSSSSSPGSNNSRIGRAWVAIREDETAAAAMGINGFGLKLIAFALGASLAGVGRHGQGPRQDAAVTPDQYVFLDVAPFLLAASSSAAWAPSPASSSAPALL